MPTAVITLKAKPGAPPETLRLPGVELRHEPEHGRVVAYRHDCDLAYIRTDEVERWSIEPE